MNIADKLTFYREIARVTRPGGTLLFHDTFEGNGQTLHFPVPWAEQSSISFLVPPARAREFLERCGFRILDLVDATDPALRWLDAVVDRVKQSGAPPLGTHLLMGETARSKLENVIRNLRDRRIVVYQARAEKL